MCWPLYLTFVWICADGIALRYDRRLGYGMVGFTVFYFALVLFCMSEASQSLQMS